MIVRLVNNIRSNEAVRHSFVLTMGTVLAQMIPLLFMLILSRYYTNESFGVYQLFYQLTVVLGVIANGRLEQPVLAVKHDEDSIGVFHTATKLSMYISAGCLFIFGLIHFIFPNQKIVADLGIWLWILPVAIWLNAKTQLLSFRLNRFKHYRTMVIAKIILVFFTSVIPAIGIFFNWNHSGVLLIAGFLIGQIVSVGYSAVKVNLPLPTTIVFTEADFRNLRQYRSFLVYSAPAILIDQLAAALPLLFIATCYGAAATGDMAFAQRILIVPSVFIAASVSQVFFKQASDYFHLKQNLFGFTLKTFAILLAIGVIPYTIILLFGHQLLPWIFGLQWLNASLITQVMVWAMILKFAISPVSVIMVITNHIKLQALWQVIALILNLMLALIAWKYLTLMDYIVGLTIMDIGLYLLYLGFILSSTKKMTS